MSLLTSFSRPVGIQQSNWIENTNPIDPSLAVAAPAANTAYLSLVRVSRAITVSKIVVEIGGASGNIDVGIYTSADESTFDRVASSGTTAQAGTNALQTISLTAAYTLVPGVNYWFACAADNAVGTVLRTSAAAANAVAISAGNKAIAKATSFVLPTSLAAMSSTTIVVWMRAIP